MEKTNAIRQPIKAVIFDMDGVIIDSEPIYFDIERKSFANFGVNIPEDEHHSFVGITLEDMWLKIKKHYRLNESVNELLDFHKSQVLNHMSELENLVPMPDVIHLLERLKEKNIKCGIASSSPRKLIEIILNKLNITSMFNVIISGEEVEKGKPAPDIFLSAADCLRVAPEECVVIEDSHNGIKAAKAAGIPCIGYINKNSGNQDLQAADMIIHSFAEISVHALNELQKNL